MILQPWDSAATWTQISPLQAQQQSYHELEDLRVGTSKQETLTLKEQMVKMQQDFECYDKKVKDVVETMEAYVKRQNEEDERRVIYDTLDKLSPGWNEPYLRSLGFGVPLTDEDRKRLKEAGEDNKCS